MSALRAADSTMRPLNTQQKGRLGSVATVLFLAGNVALNIYSQLALSAQVLQGRQEQASQSGGQLRRQLDTTTVSLMCGATVAESASSSAKFNALPRNESDAAIYVCGVGCGASALRDSTCLTKCLVERFAWNAGCGRCIGEYGYCVTSECLVPCIEDSGTVGPGCHKCGRTKCFSIFLACAGANMKTPGACGAPSDLAKWDAHAVGTERADITECGSDSSSMTLVSKTSSL
jgi:hypothetical protein